MPHVHRVVRLGNERHYLHARCCADNLPEPCVVISVEVADRSRSEAPNKYINTSTTTGGPGHDGRRPDNMDCRILGPYYFSIFTVSTKMKHTTALSGGFPWPPDSILRPKEKPLIWPIAAETPPVGLPRILSPIHHEPLGAR